MKNVIGWYMNISGVSRLCRKDGELEQSMF